MGAVGTRVGGFLFDVEFVGNFGHVLPLINTTFTYVSIKYIKSNNDPTARVFAVFAVNTNSRCLLLLFLVFLSFFNVFFYLVVFVVFLRLQKKRVSILGRILSNLNAFFSLLM